MPQIVALVSLLAVTALAGGLWRARQGRVRVTPASATPALTGESAQAHWAERGIALGTAATFIQFSAEVCSACRATARVLGALSSDEGGVAHHELDVADHLDLVREYGVLSTPTVLVLSAEGTEVARATGAMTPTQARNALARAAAAALVAPAALAATGR